MATRRKPRDAAAEIARARAYFVKEGRDDMIAWLPTDDAAVRLAPAALARVMDRCTVCGYRGGPSTISRGALSSLDASRRALGVTDFSWSVGLRRQGVKGLADLDGLGFLNLVAWLEGIGLDVDAFVAARREVTPKQVGLLHTARAKVGMEERFYIHALARFGGVTSTAHLDRRGIDLMMAVMEREGFAREPIASADSGFGQRPGFASAGQLTLISELWREWSDGDDEAGLSAWLERFHHVSSLRFLTAPAAAKVITALKAMKRRAG